MPTLPLDLASDSVFEHIRRSDNERVGYIHITDDGAFVPFDLLHRQVAEAGDLSAAEELLDSIGLTLLAEPYALEREGRTYRVGIKELTRDDVTVGPLSVDIEGGAADVDLTARWTYALPARELLPLGS